jgi:type VI secretion system protein ImpC
MTETVWAIDRLIVELDAQIAAQVDEVIHHPSFAAIEAAWRGLAYVVSRVASDENIQTFVWSYSKQAAQLDFEDASEIVKTRLFGAVYSDEYGTFGGEPFGAIFANYEVDSSPRDVALLRGLAAVAAMAHAPVLLGASAVLLKIGSFEDLPLVTELDSLFSSPQYIRWQSLRDSEDSRYLGIMLPRFLLRAPWTALETATFRYAEKANAHSKMLWGNPSFAFAVRLAHSFATTRGFERLLDDHQAAPPATVSHRLLPEQLKSSTEVVLSDRLEQELANAGLIPLTCTPSDRALRLASANSIQTPRYFGKTEGGEEATLNHFLGTRLPYLFIACRIAHYLKVIDRDRIGTHRTRDDLEGDLNAWLSQYVVDMDGIAANVRMRYPLRRASVRVSDVDGNSNFYRVEIHLRPHIKYLGAAFTMSVAGRLDRA